MKQEKKKYKYFTRGPITSKMITELISEYQKDSELGAHSIFLGQVRSDKKVKSKNRVARIDYSAYVRMAAKEMENIRKYTSNKFQLSKATFLHSIGEVKSGEISFLVFVSSPHREKCFRALEFIVAEIKTKVPIWKKEIFDDGSYRWV